MYSGGNVGIIFFNLLVLNLYVVLCVLCSVCIFFLLGFFNIVCKKVGVLYIVWDFVIVFLKIDEKDVIKKLFLLF